MKLNFNVESNIKAYIYILLYYMYTHIMHKTLLNMVKMFIPRDDSNKTMT